MPGARSVAVYGTVMGTRLEGSNVVHSVEATSPGGGWINLKVVAQKRYSGAVRVVWDPDGHIEPRFPFEMPWATLAVAVGIIFLIVLASWLLFG